MHESHCHRERVTLHVTRSSSFRALQEGEDDNNEDHRRAARMIQTAREPDNVEWAGGDACM